MSSVVSRSYAVPEPVALRVRDQHGARGPHARSPQYSGWPSDDPAGIDPAFLVVVAVTFPAFTYLIALVGANVWSNAE